MNQIEIEGNIIEYQEIGKGYPVLFIHGAFSSGKTWRKVLPKLSHHFRCIVPEWPFGGHKVPISNTVDFTPNGIADLISKIVEKLSIEKVMIITNDTGGAYAQVFAAKYGQKISHLVLSNCEGFEVFPPEKFKSLKTMVKVPGYLSLLAKLFKYRPFLKWNITFGLLSNQLTSEEIYNFYVKYFSENKLIRENFKHLASEWNPQATENAAKVLAKFSQPVLILWGKDDKELFPIELGKRLNTLFQNSTFVEISDSMTYIQEDKPMEFIESVINFSRENGL